MVEIISDEPIVARIYEDTATGIKIIEDTLGRFHLLSKEDVGEVGIGTPVYLQASVSSPWLNTTDFHDIPGMTYIVPSGAVFSLDFIIATSDKESNNLLGIYKDNVLQLSIPFGNSIDFEFNNPPTYTAGTEVKLKFKPPVVRTKLICTLAGLEH